MPNGTIISPRTGVQNLTSCFSVHVPQPIVAKRRITKKQMKLKLWSPSSAPAYSGVLAVGWGGGGGLGRGGCDCVHKAIGFVKFGKDILADVSFDSSFSSATLPFLSNASLEIGLRGC